MNPTVLVTGISGFIAKHVALELLNAGYKVRGTVREAAAADAVRRALALLGADLDRILIAMRAGRMPSLGASSFSMWRRPSRSRRPTIANLWCRLHAKAPCAFCVMGCRPVFRASSRRRRWWP